ncbi:hypothetical protein VKT23_008109 [Stygiomarasmius scandens]|uniref:Uncharacterized protein n=1 Tax=Marasmiellus scandens TaxID=2682957 RepID=A0ABR1JI71_9AGAR
MYPLPVDAICAALYSRGDGTFHWALVLPYSPTKCHKFHVSNLTGPWVYTRGLEDDFSPGKPNPICVVAQLATPLSSASNSSPIMARKLDDLLEPIPHETPAEDPPEEFRCRTWFRRAVRVLHDAGYINCSDAFALMNELWEMGGEQDEKTVQGMGFVVKKSRVTMREE